uniref:Uncharacterized protein n=1 Tax=Chenopodium quinoa TaxID=63459 RepID=A0A803N2U2_CHEQI
MGEVARSNGNHEVTINVKETNNQSSSSNSMDNSCFSVHFLQKMIAEVLGTYFVIFAGCAAVTVNLDGEKVVTLPGIAITWGLVVMVMVYSVGHISGAHFNPAVTIAFATSRRFPWKQGGRDLGSAVWEWSRWSCRKGRWWLGRWGCPVVGGWVNYSAADLWEAAAGWLRAVVQGSCCAGVVR